MIYNRSQLIQQLAQGTRSDLEQIINLLILTLNNDPGKAYNLELTAVLIEEPNLALEVKCTFSNKDTK